MYKFVNIDGRDFFKRIFPVCLSIEKYSDEFYINNMYISIDYWIITCCI